MVFLELKMTDVLQKKKDTSKWKEIKSTESVYISLFIDRQMQNEMFRCSKNQTILINSIIRK